MSEMPVAASAADLLRVLPEASAESRRVRRRLVEVLEDRAGLTADRFVRLLGELAGVAVCDMDRLRTMRPRFDLIPYPEAMRRHCAAAEDNGTVCVVTDDPLDTTARAWAEENLRVPFAWMVAHRGDLAAFLARHESEIDALAILPEGLRGAAGERVAGEDLSLGAIGDERSETVRLVRSTLRDALRAGASDIHFETDASGLHIKFRIDGMLTHVKSIPETAHADQTISRIKVLAELDITERRIPQDGRFKALDHDRTIDFRVSIMPSIFGEDAVIRILDRQPLHAVEQALSVDALGFDAADVKRIRRLSSEPYGMFLVTGPTGSGKTTTLYAAISEINRGHDKIVTIEDPVEYQLAGVLQIPVNEKKGLTFAVGLRSILRHDPDKIMVGEIRDPETASIAVQSALTGHLVFTTVHANNVFDVIGRFTHMHVDLYSFVSALNGILAQRLVRLNCPACAEGYLPSSEELAESGISSAAAAGFRFRRGRGCRECRGSGYRGRKAIAELLVLEDELRDLIAQRAPMAQLKAAARRRGTRTLRESAIAAVERGETTLEEINRVTFLD